MTNEDKKKLTEYLEEKIHEPITSNLPIMLVKFGGDIRCTCEKTFPQFMFPAHQREANRTFDTWDDLGDLKEKMVEKGDWETFKEYAYHYWVSRVTHKGEYEDKDDWLFTPSRFCQLVLEAVKQEVIK